MHYCKCRSKISPYFVVTGCIFKNVSSLHISKKLNLSVCLSENLRKLYEYANISKVIEGHKSSSNFSVNPTLPLLDGRLMLHTPSRSLFPSLSLTLTLYPSLPPSFAPCKH